MDNTVLREFRKLGGKTGVWVLRTRKDKDKFIMTNIDTFVPEGKGPTDKPLFKISSGNGYTDSMIISSYRTRLNSDLENDRHNIEILIQHKDVDLLDLPREEWDKLVRSGIKNGNPKWELKNLDWEESQDYDDENELLSLRYWLRNPEKPISLKQVIFIASFLGVPYREDVSTSSDGEILRKKTIKGIEKKISKDSDSMKKLLKVKDDIMTIEKHYFIEQMKLNGTISYKGNLYFIGDMPVGADDVSIINYFDRNIETFETYKKQIINSKKQSNFDVIGNND